MYFVACFERKTVAFCFILLLLCTILSRVGHVPNCTTTRYKPLTLGPHIIG